MRITRPYTVTDVYRKKMNVLAFDGAFEAAIGRPELRGSWLIYGRSFEGKTSFSLQLAKYLTNFGKVLYNSLEEGISASLRTGLEQVEMEDVKNRIHLLDQEPMATMIERLKLRNSADFVIVDSIQYTFMDIPDYKELLSQFPHKLFIFTSHAKGREPKGSLADAAWFDANVKIWVEGFRAFAKSRYGGGEYFDIWPEQSALIYAEL